MGRSGRGLVVALAGAVALSCGRKVEGSTATTGAPAPASTLHPAATAPTSEAQVRPQIDGRAFPDGVLALTWDDGPDVHTLELARYLHARHVSGTFFVVGQWRPGVSDDPGTGPDVMHTGYADLPILSALVALGHRVGNHTLNHVILTHASVPLVEAELKDNQRQLEPSESDELRLFRVPGGAWGAEASSTVEGDPVLRALTGPVRWDVDRKDWDSSLSCESERAAAECEELGDGRPTRTKPAVVAARYLASIDAARHGIVLLHDRVGDVGSRYALSIAHTLVPALEARGYVFSAPVLAFSPLSPRLVTEAADPADASDRADGMQLLDVDGDGRDDACLAGPGAGNPNHECHRSVEHTLEDGELRMAFEPAPLTTTLRTTGSEHALPFDPSRAVPGTDLMRSGDLNGDGRADVCGRSGSDVRCAFATDQGFTAATSWVRDSPLVHDATSMEMGDVNGDRRADICVRSGDAVSCGLAP